MSIQGTINTVISMGGILATQTPRYERNKAVMTSERTIKMAKGIDPSQLNENALNHLKKGVADAVLKEVSYGSNKAVEHLEEATKNSNEIAWAAEIDEDKAKYDELERNNLYSELVSKGDYHKSVEKAHNDEQDAMREAFEETRGSQNTALDNARKAQEYTEGKKMQKRLARNPKLLANPYEHLEVNK